MRMRRKFFFLHLSLQKYKRKFSIRTGKLFFFKISNENFEKTKNVVERFRNVIINNHTTQTEDSKRNRPFFVHVVKRLREMC